MERRHTTDYQTAERAGRRAEYLTKWLYHLIGYSCVAMRQKTPFGELDLIMRRGGKILIIVVKFRRHLDNPESGIPTSHQLMRIQKAALWISAHHAILKGKQIELRLVQWCGWTQMRQTDIRF